MVPVPLLRVHLDGELVAEADLTVYDQSGAWNTFVQCYPSIAHLIAGELFGTMHAACNDEIRAKTEATGLTLDLWTKPRPNIFVPQNGTH